MLHDVDPQLLTQVSTYMSERLSYVDTPLDAGGSAAQNAARARELVAGTITPGGMGARDAFSLFTDELAPLVMSADSPRFLSFIPAAPSPAALVMDAVVSASSMQACSWFEASGSVAAEEAAGEFLCRVAGLPAGSAAVFVSGGSAANLSALAVARDTARAAGRAGRVVVVSESSHTSVAAAARLLDVRVVVIPAPSGRLTREDLDGFFAANDCLDACALVVTAGSTNAGLVDDLQAASRWARERGLWLHVDAAYGGAGLLDDRTRGLFDGIEDADSVTMDPHKWWFSGYDCGALLYARPRQAAAVHTQDAAYLDAIHDDDVLVNPSDMAFHLTRRARGVPLWFALAAYGTDAFTDAVSQVLDVTEWFVGQVRSRAGLSLVVEPDLSVVLFEKAGWGSREWWQWSDRVREQGLALALPTVWQGRTVGRVVLLNPRTSKEMLAGLLDSLDG